MLRYNDITSTHKGEVTEWSIVRLSKSRRGASSSGVRISPSPQNTKILIRTIDRIEEFGSDIKNSGLNCQTSEDEVHIDVAYSDLEKFSKIIRKYLNAPYNYVNVKFPDKKLNVLIFPNKDFVISDKSSDMVAKDWALTIGLSEPETHWTTFY